MSGFRFVIWRECCKKFLGFKVWHCYKKLNELSFYSTLYPIWGEYQFQYISLFVFPFFSVRLKISVVSSSIKLKHGRETKYTHMSIIRIIDNDSFLNKNASKKCLPKTGINPREMICVLFLLQREVIVWVKYQPH